MQIKACSYCGISGLSVIAAASLGKPYFISVSWFIIFSIVEFGLYPTERINRADMPFTFASGRTAI